MKNRKHCTLFVSVLVLLLMSVLVDSSFASPVYKVLTQDPSGKSHSWLNTSRPLEPNDLKGRILLLDFWTFCCINCMHVIPDLHKLEKEFGDGLTVLGVHSAKFNHEKEIENIRAAVLRYDIEHPVVNDSEFYIWRSFGVRAWPTFVLIDPKGEPVKGFSGEGNYERLRQEILALQKKFEGKVRKGALPIALENKKKAETLLSFPSKLAYAEDQKILFISDSNHHRVLGVRLDLNAKEGNGEILFSVGAGIPGWVDGSFEKAKFNKPQGIAYDSKTQTLIVADTENHLLREIDLKQKKLKTLAGTGKQGYEREVSNKIGTSTPLSSPWDVTFLDDKHQKVLIAMAGTHQLWSFDRIKNTVSIVAGNGKESIDDGAYPQNSLSQPSGISRFENKVYFVDSETSSLRVFENGKIQTLIGSGLFDFGLKDGNKEVALMQHPLGVFADATGVYIADSYNHSIRKYDPETKKLSTIVSAKSFKPASLSEPAGLLKIKDKLFIANTNQHSILTFDLRKQKLETFNVFSKKEKKDALPLAVLPHLKEKQTILVKENLELTLVLDLNQGWKINDQAPSVVRLFEQKDSTFVEKQKWETGKLKKLKLKLPKLKKGQSFRVQGTLYFCKEQNGATCHIRSFDQTLKPAQNQKDSTIVWHLEP